MSYRTTIKFDLAGSAIPVPQTGYNTVQNSTSASVDNSFVGEMLVASGILFFILLLVIFFAKRRERSFRIETSVRSKIFSIFFCLFLACGFGFCFAVCNSSGKIANATESDLSVPATLEISGNVGEFAYGCETLTLNIATENGFAIYASSVDTTNFVAADGNSFIEVIPENGALSDNSWGLTEKTTEVEKTNNWISVPKYIDGENDGVLVKNYDDETEAGQETTVCYGFSSTEESTPGEYTAVIDFRVAIDEKTPKAILGLNGNLNFVFDEDTYATGESYFDNLGETTILSVYPVSKNAATVTDVDSSDNDEIAFNHNDSITSANFDESFFDFKPRSTAFWFWHDDNLESITNAENLNVSKVTNLKGMFAFAGSDVEEVSFSGLGDWETDNVTNMSYMFNYAGQNASSFAIDDLSGWNTENVVDIDYMFREAGVETLNLSGWDLRNITDMHWLFHNSSRYIETVSLDLSNWNVSNLAILRGMFWKAGENAMSYSLDVSGWNTENAEDMSYMFDDTAKDVETFTLTGVEGLNTSNVTDMREMFSNTARDADYALDLSGWDVTNVTNHSGFNNGVTDKIIAPIWAD